MLEIAGSEGYRQHLRLAVNLGCWDPRQSSRYRKKTDPRGKYACEDFADFTGWRPAAAAAQSATPRDEA